jgi:uncharacterized protein YkwD
MESCSPENEVAALALLGTLMIRTSAALALCGVVFSVAPAGLGENSPPPSLRPTFYQDLARADVVISVAPAGLGENSPPPSVQPTLYQDLARADATVDAAAAQSMISGYRSNNRLEPLAVDPELMRIASEQARAMAARDKMDHHVGRPFQERMRKAGFGGSVAIENVGAGYHTLAEAFSGWRDSPPHRANMLNRSVTRMGIAAAYAPASKYKVFWALIFAGPDRRRG